VTVDVAPGDVAMLRVSMKNDFPLPPIIVADSCLISLRSTGRVPQKLTGTITVTNKGSSGLPPWLSVTVSKNGKSQTFINTVSTAGLKKGLYHAVVRADNTEPVSGQPMSALYYDVDLEVTREVSDQPD